jgi:hypothetical protein
VRSEEVKIKAQIKKEPWRTFMQRQQVPMLGFFVVVCMANCYFEDGKISSDW